MATEKKAVKKATTKKVAKASGAKIKVTYVRSFIGGTERQRDTIRGLGLRKLNSSKVLIDTPEVRGMITKVAHLVEVEPA